MESAPHTKPQFMFIYKAVPQAFLMAVCLPCCGPVRLTVLPGDKGPIKLICAALRPVAMDRQEPSRTQAISLW